MYHDPLVWDSQLHIKGPPTASFADMGLVAGCIRCVPPWSNVLTRTQVVVFTKPAASHFMVAISIYSRMLCKVIRRIAINYKLPICREN